MNEEYDELIDMLGGVRDSYDEFVLGAYAMARNNGLVERLELYLKSNAEASTSQVLEWLLEAIKLHGSSRRTLSRLG